ncbi:HAD family hydrolase [Patescibacteria group bacterium]|nr:HAD family hydrolase [Patescibacteria group bacterium]MCL5797558.1 HAD family hydrolase [Patescibacteria group bacterium]
MMKSLNYQLILFDIDWTLLKGNLQEHVDGFQYAWKKVLGIEARLSDWPTHHGQPDAVILEKLPQISHGIKSEIIHNKIEDLKGAKEEYFFAHCRQDYTEMVMPGVRALLSELKKRSIPLAIKSGNLEKIGWFRLEKAGLKDFFITGGFGDNVSSKAESVEQAISRIGKIVNTKFVHKNIYDVGDSKYDIEADLKVGINGIAVASGFDSREVLRKTGAKYILDSLVETDKFLEIISG